MERGEVNKVEKQRKAKVMSFEDLERAQAEVVIEDARKTEKETKKAAKEVINVVGARTRRRGSCRRPKTCGRNRKNAA
jgi:hypothetical protein